MMVFCGKHPTLFLLQEVFQTANVPFAVMLCLLAPRGVVAEYSRRRSMWAVLRQAARHQTAVLVLPRVQHGVTRVPPQCQEFHRLPLKSRQSRDKRIPVLREGRPVSNSETRWMSRSARSGVLLHRPAAVMLSVLQGVQQGPPPPRSLLGCRSSTEVPGPNSTEVLPGWRSGFVCSLPPRSLRQVIPEYIYVSRRPLQRVFHMHACFLSLCSLPSVSSPVSVSCHGLMPSSSTPHMRDVRALRAKMKREGKQSRERYLFWLTLGDVRREVSLGRKLCVGGSCPLAGGEKSADFSERDTPSGQAAGGTESKLEGRDAGGEEATERCGRQGLSAAGSPSVPQSEALDVERSQGEKTGTGQGQESTGFSCIPDPRTSCHGEKCPDGSVAGGRGGRKKPKRARGAQRSAGDDEGGGGVEDELQAAEELVASGGDVLDFSADLLCPHNHLRVQSLTNKAKLQQRFLVSSSVSSVGLV